MGRKINWILYEGTLIRLDNVCYITKLDSNCISITYVGGQESKIYYDTEEMRNEGFENIKEHI